jgi:hypothetical protein
MKIRGFEEPKAQDDRRDAKDTKGHRRKELSSGLEEDKKKEKSKNPCAHGIETEDVLRTARLLIDRHHTPSCTLEHPLGAAAGAVRTAEQKLSQHMETQSKGQREEE